MRHKETLTAQEKALQELDAEYLRYRKAIEFAFMTAETMVENALRPVMAEISSLRQVVESKLPQEKDTVIRVEVATEKEESPAERMNSELEACSTCNVETSVNAFSSFSSPVEPSFEQDEATDVVHQERPLHVVVNVPESNQVITPLEVVSKDVEAPLETTPPAEKKSTRGRKKKVQTAEVAELEMKSPRIRWGSTEEEVKKTVFEKLNDLENQGLEISVNNIKSHYASMMRYIYGKEAIFKGIGALLDEYEDYKQPLASSNDTERLTSVQAEEESSIADKE
ncbi:hypothetical protein [Heliorestis convoluta]|uniref:Uncharacterized protein n=1 Tax=Heliorestis convoluta TaxID=356322 RepID=A0A5Q2N1R5_9FIRM|nr:hypothetical protein [Heliorestis convoluta]QGG47556.1 hypothetical protein FTV88_1409 [Heliorestis convoluta]